MKTLESFSRFLSRFRYPVTLPEDVAKALGIDLSNKISFEEFLNSLTNCRCRPTRIRRYMPREQAEEAFEGAQRKEYFTHSTLISYYFNEGWVEFNLEFDSEARLRRVYVDHREIKKDRGVELSLYS